MSLLHADAIDLPSPPQSLAAVVQAASDPDASPGTLADLVSVDPALSAKVLAVANSSLYRRGAPVTSVAHAVGVLGVRQLRNVALCAAAQASVDKRRLGAFHLSRFWENSLRRAVAARVLAGIDSAVDPMLAFTAGLLQDLGVVALVQTKPELAPQWMEVERELPEVRLAKERELFGVGHDEVAATLAQCWGLPRDLASAMAGHHGDLCAPEHQALCAVTRHAEWLAAVLSVDDKRAALERLRLCLARDRGLARPDVDALVDEVAREVKEMALVLGVKVRAQPSLESIRQAAFSGLQRLNLSYEQLVEHLEASLALQDRLTNELQLRNTELERLASTDALTELPNRRAFWAALNRLLEQAGDADINGLLLIDADHFKSINDTHGHEVGDVVLRHLAQILKTGITTDEVLARVGGEEFAVAFVAREADFGARLAARLVEAVRGQPCEVAGLDRPLSLSVSIGVASIDGTARSEHAPVDTARHLYRAADAALYHAKEAGRGRYVNATDSDAGRPRGWLARLRSRVA